MESNPGLDNVIVADTKISDVDGERGKLTIAGHDVEALAGHTSLETAIGYVLAAAGMPIGSLETELATARAAAFELLGRLGDALDRDDGMEALRVSLAHLRSHDDRRDAIAAIAATAVFAAAWHRKQRDAVPIAPTAGLGHAADVRSMLGELPDPAKTAALETYLVSVIDHGMNASTFAARVVASTRSDLISAVVAGIGALKGPLHGGAPGPVLDMMDAIGEPARADAWLRAELAAGRRIMGMGHRVYRVRDPRAAVLERAIATLGVQSPRLALARAVETAAGAILAEKHPDRPMGANVELATAILLDAIGLPRTMFSPMFAIGRVAGWSAHVIEQRRVPRIMRPASRYIA